MVILRRRGFCRYLFRVNLCVWRLVVTIGIKACRVVILLVVRLMVRRLIVNVKISRTICRS